MKTLESSQNKIQKIADQLRKETLEPAHVEAKQIIDNAKEEADQILKKAQDEAAALLMKAQKNIEQEKNIFQSSLAQATRQGIEVIKQAIEKELFAPLLLQTVKSETANPQVVAELIQAMIHAIDKEGLATDLDVLVGKVNTVEEINKYLSSEILKRVKKQTVTLGEFEGGVKVKVLDQNLTLEMTDKTIYDLIVTHIHKDFRKLFFAR